MCLLTQAALYAWKNFQAFDASFPSFKVLHIFTICFHGVNHMGEKPLDHEHSVLGLATEFNLSNKSETTGPSWPEH